MYVNIIRFGWSMIILHPFSNRINVFALMWNAPSIYLKNGSILFHCGPFYGQISRAYNTLS